MAVNFHKPYRGHRLSSINADMLGKTARDMGCNDEQVAVVVWFYSHLARVAVKEGTISLDDDISELEEKRYRARYQRKGLL